MYSQMREQYLQAFKQKQELSRPTSPKELSELQSGILNQEDGAPLMKLGTEDDGSEIEGARS